jgi:hypothetical protein
MREPSEEVSCATGPPYKAAEFSGAGVCGSARNQLPAEMRDAEKVASADQTARLLDLIHRFFQVARVTPARTFVSLRC